MMPRVRNTGAVYSLSNSSLCEKQMLFARSACGPVFMFETQCWCDDGTAEYDQNGQAVCDMECAGSTDGEFCGGFDAMSIRQHEVVPYYNEDYIGCFSDPADSRMFDLVASSDDMTAEVRKQPKPSLFAWVDAGSWFAVEQA